MALSPCKSLVDGAASLLNSEKYSDLTITTQTRSFKVHKAIVCTQSKVLAAMSDSGFKETSTAVLQLEHDDPATVERMLTFLYTGDYDAGNPDAAVGNVGPFLMANTLLYSIADKYDLQGLKSLAKSQFENSARAAWGCGEFPAIVAKIFDSTPDTDLGLRDVVSHICAEHIDHVLLSDTWTDLLADNGAIGVAVFTFARIHWVTEAKDARSRMELCEQELDWANSCRRRLHERFDDAREDLDIIVDKWDKNRGDEVCDRCWDGSFDGLKHDLAYFKRGLPTRLESTFL